MRHEITSAKNLNTSLRNVSFLAPEFQSNLQTNHYNILYPIILLLSPESHSMQPSRLPTECSAETGNRASLLSKDVRGI